MPGRPETLVTEAGMVPPPLCPSAPATLPGARIIGVVEGPAEAPRVRHLGTPRPVPPALPAVLAPLRMGEVLRVAAPCAGGACLHHEGTRCRLADGIVERLAPAVERLPPCAIRAECLWWRQRGRDACRRCPAVVTTRRVRGSAVPGEG
ncbi:hypothetical protein [Roseomonas elaeocarpi]|uniref:Nitrogen fixation protein n=1 Tax=Roseomonas elaeocarpi TaxID=907779 RepID=A0ABV6JY16_9PROT